MNKRIIINADDFGLSHGVNEAVFEAHTRGVLTSATIMVNMPFADEAIKMAKGLPGFGTGVHLNLSEGKPISKDARIACLLDDSNRFVHSPSRLAILSVLRRKIKTAVAIEMTAQVRYIVDRGLKPTHLDSHKHIHCFPCFFPIVCELAENFEINAIRWPFEPKYVCRKSWPPPGHRQAQKAAIIRLMAGINRLQNTRFLKNNVFFGIAHTGKIDLSFFQALATYVPVGTAELMTHPGYPDGLQLYKTRLLKQRENELNTLCDEKTKRYLMDAGIKLVHYGSV